jgi:hypothetical protein
MTSKNSNTTAAVEAAPAAAAAAAAPVKPTAADIDKADKPVVVDNKDVKQVPVVALTQQKQKWGDMEDDDAAAAYHQTEGHRGDTDIEDQDEDEDASAAAGAGADGAQAPSSSSSSTTKKSHRDKVTSDKKYGDPDYPYPPLKSVVKATQYDFINKKARPDPNKDELKYVYDLTDAERRAANMLCSRITSGMQVADDIGINAFVRIRARPPRKVKYYDAHKTAHEESDQVGQTGLTVDYEQWNKDRAADLARLDKLRQEAKNARAKNHGKAQSGGFSMTEEQYRIVKEDLEKQIVTDARPYRNEQLFANKQLVRLVHAFESAKKGIDASREQLLRPTTLMTVQFDANGNVIKRDGKAVKVPMVARDTFYSMGIMDYETYSTTGEPMDANEANADTVKRDCYLLTIVPELKKRYQNLGEYVKYLFALHTEAHNRTLSDYKRDRAARTLEHFQTLAAENISYVLKHLTARRRSLFHRETLLYASFNDMSDAYKTEHGQRVPNRERHHNGRATGGRGGGRGVRGGFHGSRPTRGGRASS